MEAAVSSRYMLLAAYRDQISKDFLTHDYKIEISMIVSIQLIAIKNDWFEKDSITLHLQDLRFILASVQRHSDGLS